MNGDRMMTSAWVVATKDRPHDLAKMLESLGNQTVLPEQVVIVDASTEPVQAVAESFPQLSVKYLRAARPSASAQRNAGVREVDPDIDLIGFLDDDIVLEPDALKTMLAFWKAAPERMGGAAFNWLNTEPRALVGIKQSRLAGWLGLYATEIGGVAPSGWQAVTGEVDRTTRVRWLPSGASVWRREIFESHQFDPFFDGYSYLEDLEFSYRVGKEYDLYVVAGAGFRHYPGKGGRISQFNFGKIEVRNRLYFVRKHGLSVVRCYAGLGTRLLMTLATAVRQRNKAAFQRACGNVAGLLRSWQAIPRPSSHRIDDRSLRNERNGAA